MHPPSKRPSICVIAPRLSADHRTWMSSEQAAFRAHQYSRLLRGFQCGSQSGQFTKRSPTAGICRRGRQVAGGLSGRLNPSRRSASFKSDSLVPSGKRRSTASVNSRFGSPHCVQLLHLISPRMGGGVKWATGCEAAAHAQAEKLTSSRTLAERRELLLAVPVLLIHERLSRPPRQSKRVRFRRGCMLNPTDGSWPVAA
jgi:hypothetical protein